jgi:hypothetical protein
MANNTKTFRPRLRPLRRARISLAEVIASLAILLLIGLTGAWFSLQRNNYDPADRDVSMAALHNSGAKSDLYSTPLRPWRENAAAAQPGEGEAAPDLGPFPEAVLEGGWQPASRLQEFTPDTLYEKINGAADQFLQYGFKKMHFMAIAHPEANGEINIELYNMGSFPNALGIFAAQRHAEREVKRYGLIHYYTTGAGSIALFGSFYMKNYGTDTSGTIQEKAVQIIRAMMPLAGGEKVIPLPYTMLSEDMGLDFAAIAYKPENVFQYSFAKDFWFGTLDTESGMSCYIHKAADRGAAADLFEKLRENHRYDYTIAKEEKADLYFKHQVLDSYLTLHRREHFVFGIQKPPSLEAAESALEKLRPVIRKHLSAPDADAPEEDAAEEEEAAKEEEEAAEKTDSGTEDSASPYGEEM